MIPRNDRVLIQRIAQEHGPIILTDRAKSQLGKVLAVGEGVWVPGEWWFIKGKWEWIDGYRAAPQVKVGDAVLFNSKWNDLAKDHYEDLPIGADSNIHLVQEADILAKL